MFYEFLCCFWNTLICTKIDEESNRAELSLQNNWKPAFEFEIGF